MKKRYCTVSCNKFKPFSFICFWKKIIGTVVKTEMTSFNSTEIRMTIKGNKIASCSLMYQFFSLFCTCHSLFTFQLILVEYFFKELMSYLLMIYRYLHNIWAFVNFFSELVRCYVNSVGLFLIGIMIIINIINIRTYRKRNRKVEDIM